MNTVSLKISAGDPEGSTPVVGSEGDAGREHFCGPAIITVCER